ncbi:DUF4395 domain-containing protein [Tomitella biformata]|uniref:DUF4395 domain-containing protein n=1 Tax=Tomitella biformata TaxID=630403 RepID=UPI0004BC2BD2|nr:DUF4395 domain-containing protein [Tomitella biformata]
MATSINTSSTTTAHDSARPQVDVRGPRFAAWVTTAVLAIVLLTGAWWLLAAQALVFAIGAALGPRRSPYGLLFASQIAPRLQPATEREPVAPLRFAQTVGFVFAAVGVLGYATGHPLLGAIATAFALVAALLNAAFGFCLGCQLYPLIGYLRRIRSA